MASYNGAKYIQKQIDSVIGQLAPDDEIIISDDGSTDETLEIIKSFQDSRIQIYLHETGDNSREKSNYKITRNFENSLSRASGDIIFLCDQDDIWVPNKVREVLKVFNNSGSILVMHDAIVKDDKGNIISDSYFSIVNSRSGFIKNILWNSYLGCCIAFTKNILDKVLPFPVNLIAHDMWIGLLAERNGKVFFLEEKLITYCRHVNTASRAANKSTHSIFFKIQYRIQFLWQYVSRIILLKLGFIKIKSLRYANMRAN